MFCENEYDWKTSQKIINNFENKTRGISSNDNNNADKNWIPKIGAKVKKKFRFRAAFQMSPNLKNILWKNKHKLIPSSYLGVYQVKFSCRSVYKGETKKKIISRLTDHQHETINGWSNWTHKGIPRPFRLATPQNSLH